MIAGAPAGAVLRLEGVVSEAHGHRTFDKLTLSLYAGETLGVSSPHRLVKDDLVDLIMGRKGAAAGRFYVDERASPFEFADDRRRSSGVVRPQSALIDDLSVAQNIFLADRAWGALSANERARAVLRRFDLPLDPRLPVRRLSVEARCRLEIVKAMALGARWVILQDLSTFLADREIERLLGFIAPLKARGGAFVLIDSSEALCFRHADRTLIVKAGRCGWEVSREAASRFPARTVAPAAVYRAGEAFALPPALAFEKVCCGALHALSFSIGRGEMHHLVDPSGQAIEDIRAVLAGEKRPDSGRVRVDGRPFPPPRAWWRAPQTEVAVIVENPADNLLFPDLTAIDNLCLPAGRKIRGFWMKRGYRESCLRDYAPYFADGALHRYPDELSLRDRHLLVYCRWHLYRPAAVVCVKPFNAVEKELETVSAQGIALLRRKGVAVLVLAANVGEADAVEDDARIERMTPLAQRIAVGGERPGW